MRQTDLLRRYREMEIMTSSPAKLILLLYEEAIKCLIQAKTKIEEKHIEESHHLLLKAQRIIRELMRSLNLEVGEIAICWYRLYEYIHDRLIQANLTKKPDILEEVLELLQPLREAWNKAMEEVNENRN